MFSFLYCCFENLHLGFKISNETFCFMFYLIRFGFNLMEFLHLFETWNKWCHTLPNSPLSKLKFSLSVKMCALSPGFEIELVVAHDENKQYISRDKSTFLVFWRKNVHFGWYFNLFKTQALMLRQQDENISRHFVWDVGPSGKLQDVSDTISVTEYVEGNGAS